MLLRVVTAVLLVLAAVVDPASAQRAGDWTENDLDLLGLKPEDVATDAGFWYWRLAYSLVDWRANDSHPITDFSGTLLLPPRSISLLTGLRFGSASTAPDRDTGKPSYTVVLDRPASEPGMWEWESQAAFRGTLGRDVVSEAAAVRRVDERFADCEPSAAYCAPKNPYVGDGYPPHSEVFFGLTVGGRRAVVSHGICCHGEGWSVVWFDPAADTSYGFDLHLDVASHVGARGLDPANVRYAQQLVDLAASLVPVKVPRVPLTPLQVAEAMRSCSPIRDIRADSTVPTLERHLVYVEGGAEELFLVEFADVGGPASITAENYRHHLDPRVALIFVRYPGSMEPPAPWAEIQAFHDRVRACFHASPP